MADGPRVPPPPEVIANGFTRLVEGLRQDVREDIRDLRTELGKTEERVTARVALIEAGQTATRALIEAFAGRHGQEHEEEAEARAKAHGQFWDFMRANELDKARRDGAVGVVRFGVELLSKHAGQIVAILAALGLLGGFATGNISVGIGQ